MKGFFFRILLSGLTALAFGAAATPLAAAAPPARYDPLAALAAGEVRLVAPDRRSPDRFGASVAASGDTIFVGRANGDTGDRGKVYVFVRGAAGWALQQELEAADGEDGDNFGWAVAVSGDTLVVGAFYDDVEGAADRGSAYVFTRSGAAWTQRHKLTASDGAAGDQFGGSVTLAGDTLLVGAPGDDVGANVNQGCTYVFTRSGDAWTERTKLVADDGAEWDFFGGAVLSGETALISSYADDYGGVYDKGSVYVFTGSGSDWVQQAHFSPDDGGASENFGTGIALRDDTAVIGSIYDHVDGKDAQGSAYVYVRSGDTWALQQKLTAADGAAGDYFSAGLAVRGDLIVAGSPLCTVGGSAQRGAAYLFVRTAGAWGLWRKVVSSDGAEGDRFGGPVTLNGTDAVVSACGDDGERGAVYVLGLGPGRPQARSPKGLIRSRTPTLKWSVAADATSYEVRVMKGRAQLKAKTGIRATSWRCTRRLPRGVWLTWKVRAANAAGAGAWSSSMRFKVK